MAGGRPSTYDPTYCESVVEWGKLGKSLAWIAAELDCSKQTLHNWMEAHPEFLDAMEVSRVHSQKWWEDAGQVNMLMPAGSGTFNGSVWSRSMAARFPEDWREKSETALTGAGGGPVQIIASQHDENL